MSGILRSLKNFAAGGTAPGEDTQIRFSVFPLPGDSGFQQWHSAMKMVARLPGGIPAEFRRTLWLALADKHLQQRGVDWPEAEKLCFSEWSTPDDEDLGVQIVKDLHRTGCSMFCGQSNQAVLKRVLLAYARWNKAVGYCQGFNMLAALILQVVDRCERDAVKVMIFLIEGVLPESYFANNLRGLSVDMAVFRDLLRLRLQHLSKHLEQLQADARDSSTGTIYEPPLTNVFTMQWFLTLFCNCLPQPTVLRVWDLIFLEGNEILLRTALAIWDTLADRIMTVRSADEFYSIMGVLTREILEFGLMDPNHLIKTVVSLSCPELPALRDKHLYNISPWTVTVSSAATSAARRGLRLFYAEGDSDRDESEDEDNEQIAVATAFGISSVFRSPKRRGSISSAPLGSSMTLAQTDREKIALDISVLKQQYQRLRERQRQAQIILSAACAGPSPLGTSVGTPSTAMNHLLVGKSALRSNKGRRLGPPPGAVPPPTRRPRPKINPTPPQLPPPAPVPDVGETLLWKDTTKRDKLQKNLKEKKGFGGLDNVDEDCNTLEKSDVEESLPEAEAEGGADSDASSTSTELCDDPGAASDLEVEELPRSDGDTVLIHVEECPGGDDDAIDPPGAAAVSPAISPSPAVSPASPSVERTSTDERSTFSEMSVSLSADTSLKLSPIPSDSVSDSTFKNEDWLGDVELSATSVNSSTLVDNWDEEKSIIERTADLVSSDLVHGDGGSSFIKTELTVKPDDLSISDPVVKGDGDITLVSVERSNSIDTSGVELSMFKRSDSTSKVEEGSFEMLMHADSNVKSGDVGSSWVIERSYSAGKSDSELSRFGSLECSESSEKPGADLSRLGSIQSDSVIGDGDSSDVMSIQNDDLTVKYSSDFSRTDCFDQPDLSVGKVTDKGIASGLVAGSDLLIKHDDGGFGKMNSFERDDSVKTKNTLSNVSVLGDSNSITKPDESVEEVTGKRDDDRLSSFGLFNQLDSAVNDYFKGPCFAEKSDSPTKESDELNISDLVTQSGADLKRGLNFINLSSDDTEELIDDLPARNYDATHKTSDDLSGLRFGDISGSAIKSDHDFFSISGILGKSSILKSETEKSCFEPESMISSLSRTDSKERSDLKSTPIWLSSVSKESQETDVEVSSSNVEDSGYSSVSTKDADSNFLKKLREDVTCGPVTGSQLESLVPTLKSSEGRDWSKRSEREAPVSRVVSDEEMTKRDDDHLELKMWRPPVDRDRDCLSDASSYISPVRVPSSTSSVIDSDECRGTDWSRMSSRETYSERGITRQLSEYKDVSPGPEDDLSDSSKPCRRNLPLQSSLTQESDEFNLSSDTGSSKDSKDRPIARLFRREESTWSNDDKMFIREESIVSNEEDSLRSSALDLGEFGDEAKVDDFATFDEKNVNLCQGERAKSAAGDVEGVTSSSKPKRERLGRQNSERVMKVIKENTEMLQRMQSWQRDGRSSTSDEESQEKRKYPSDTTFSKQSTLTSTELKESFTAEEELEAQKKFPPVPAFSKQSSLTALERRETAAIEEVKKLHSVTTFSSQSSSTGITSDQESSTFEDKRKYSSMTISKPFSPSVTEPQEKRNGSPSPGHRTFSSAELTETEEDTRELPSVTLFSKQRSMSATESKGITKEQVQTYSSLTSFSKQLSFPMEEPKATPIRRASVLDEPRPWLPADTNITAPLLGSTEKLQSILDQAFSSLEASLSTRRPSDLASDKAHARYKFPEMSPVITSPLQTFSSLAKDALGDSATSSEKVRWKPSSEITPPSTPIVPSTEELTRKSVDTLTRVNSSSKVSESLSKISVDDDSASWKPSSLEKRKSKAAPSSRNEDESTSVTLEPFSKPTTLSVQMPLFREEKTSTSYEWQRPSSSPDEDSAKAASEASGKGPLKFSPFPVRPAVRHPKDLGVKLGLYRNSSGDKSPTGRK